MKYNKIETLYANGIKGCIKVIADPIPVSNTQNKNTTKEENINLGKVPPNSSLPPVISNYYSP